MGEVLEAGQTEVAALTVWAAVLVCLLWSLGYQYEQRGQEARTELAVLQPSGHVLADVHPAAAAAAADQPAPPLRLHYMDSVPMEGQAEVGPEEGPT